MGSSEDKPRSSLLTEDTAGKAAKPQAYYDAIKARFAEERDLRLNYRPDGASDYLTDLSGDLSRYEEDPRFEAVDERSPINDAVECLFIGGGFSALLTAVRLRERGVESIRIVERGADVGGTWYWNRYPGVACDVPAYDYLPLLDEMDYVPSRYYAKGPEIFAHCQAIAKKYDLYKRSVFGTTVVSTTWDDDAKLWIVRTNRGDTMKARFVICANGIACKPKLAKIEGLETFAGHSFHTSRWDFEYTKDDLSGLAGKSVGIIGTGATAVQVIPRVAKTAKDLYVFQRTPSSIDIRDDRPTDPKWAATLEPGWQAARREEHMRGEVNLHARSGAKSVASGTDILTKADLAAISRDEKIRRQENSNIDYMMRIHQRIDEIVDDPATADALKPWYMFMCKRPCFDDEYLPAFNRPNVHLIDTKGKGVTSINEQGPVVDGVTYPLDVLIYATGFEIQKTGLYNEIRGRGGKEINDAYADGIRTLFGVHTHGFPNLFVMGGYQASFQFNATFILQTQGDHIAACIAHTREHGWREIDVSNEAGEWWVQQVISHRGKTNRNAECTPGYYNFEGGANRRQDGNYNGGFLQYYNHMQAAREDFNEKFDFC